MERLEPGAPQFESGLTQDEQVAAVARQLAASADAAELGPVPLHVFPLTDSGNAERFESRYGDSFRYSQPEKLWYGWTGTHWSPDRTGRAMQAAKVIVRELYREAADISFENAGLRKSVASWARLSESLDRRRAMLVLAQSESRIPTEPDSWNTDPWLFNCLNGTVNLRTGELRPHQKADHITRLAPVEYFPTARSGAWERFLQDATGDDRDFTEFLQRAAGYSLTGDTREEKLFMVLGPTGSGKSTFLEALKAVLGDYARVADFESFIVKRDAGIRNDIAALAGRRMVCSIEVEEGRHLAEAVLKSLTGRDTITARFLHQEFFEFRPQFKLWLAANKPPKVRHHDDAMWRRILRLPFDIKVTAERCDKTLKDRLCSEPGCQQAIFAWAVEGCLRWLEDGLQEPERVKGATALYRDEQNPLREFIGDRCVLDSGSEVGASMLRGEYERWAAQAGCGDRTLSPNRFAEHLRALGCQQARTSSGRYWVGLRLADAVVV